MTNQPAPDTSGGPPAKSNGFDLNRPTIISLLYILSFATGITGIIGIIMAHVWGSEPEAEWQRSHYSYLMRTFWYGFLASIIAGVLSLVFIGLLMFPLIAVWFGVRSVMSLVRAQRREPMPDPETLWV